MVSRRRGPCVRRWEDRGCWHTTLKAEISVGLTDEGTGLGGLGSDGSVNPRGVGGDVCVLHCHPRSQQRNVACGTEALEPG